MNADQLEGTVRNFAGKAQDAVGDAVGDAQTRVRGKINQGAGKAQEMYGQAVDEVVAMASERPLGAMAAAAGVGLILGFLLARR
jgi:uncharacterized protein YjbJ (UPF0337 family)